ncbi:hypothetical protein FDECE_11283 [Fusarium decemcellulare]|nr:hypothetical protein FDECE_11283 [Fusarium decemcellulare]
MAKSVARAITANSGSPAGSRGLREKLATVLLGLALLGLVVTMITLVIMITAGSFLVNNDPDSPGPMRPFLSRFAIVKFDGVVPDPENNTSFLVTLNLFLTSFAWTYPSAPSKVQSAGLRRTIDPRVGLSLPSDLVHVGQSVDLDESAWGCYVSESNSCNSFYAFFHQSRSWGKKQPFSVTFLFHVFALWVAFCVLYFEIKVAFFPSWFRCKHKGVMRQICPCPRCEPHENALLPPSFWDRYRLWGWLPLSLYGGLVGFMSNNVGSELVQYLRYANQDAQGGSSIQGIEARMGSEFLNLTWACGIASSFSTLCILGRLLLSHTKPGWMEREAFGYQEEGVVGQNKET